MTQLGLITTWHGGGSYINNYDDDYLMSILQYITVISDDLLIDLIQVRRVLETEAARLAAENATEDQLTKIKKCAYDRTELCKRYWDNLKAVREELNVLDYEFHKNIAEASGNRVISAFILNIHATFTEHQNRASAKAHFSESVNKKHTEIVCALVERNASLSSQLMHEHLQMVEEAISDMI
jgi:DNA-binding FadR family transcriptional regulator